MVTQPKTKEMVIFTRKKLFKGIFKTSILFKYLIFMLNQKSAWSILKHKIGAELNTEAVLITRMYNVPYMCYSFSDPIWYCKWK